MMITKMARNRRIFLRGLGAILALLFLNLLIPPPPAAAQLVLSPDGNLVYDTVNNVSWLADTNLPASNRFGLSLCKGSGPQPCVNASGSMNYQTATAWVAAMNTANYLGHNNWQLPTTPLTDKTCPKTGPNGGSFGFGCAASAFGSLWNGLGLKAPHTAVPIPNNTVGPFSNFQPYLYWSQTSAGPSQGNSTFSFATGWQGANTLPNFLYLMPMIQGKIPGTPPATGNSLQVNPGGQTVYDPMTDITWLANANLAATNTFGLPPCNDPTTPAICVAQDGAMTWDSASQFITNLNSAAYLGQTHWQASTIDPICPGYNCGGVANPMGNLFYSQLGFSQGMSVVAVPDIAVGSFHNIQPYLYWTCQGATIQSACQTDGPAPNFEWSFSFGSGFQGTDLLANDLYVTAYYVGPPTSVSGPVINPGGVLNNASYAKPPVLAPGTIVEVFGTSLTDGTTAYTPSSTLPTTLAGATLLVNGIPAPLFTAAPGGINAQLPVELVGATSATIQVQVKTAGGTVTSATMSVPVAPFSPGIFTWDQNGTGPGAILHNSDFSKVCPHGRSDCAPSPAARGEVVDIFMTGLGQVNGTWLDGQPNPRASPTATTPTVTMGGVQASVAFAGLAQGYPGLYQVNVTVPQNAPTGDTVPLFLTIGGVTSNTVTLAVQ